MTSSELFREIGNISEEYIAEAQDWKCGVSRRTLQTILGSGTFRRTLAAAACMVLCLGLFGLFRKMGIGYDSAVEMANEGVSKADYDMMVQEAAPEPPAEAKAVGEYGNTDGAAGQQSASVAESSEEKLWQTGMHKEEAVEEELKESVTESAAKDEQVSGSGSRIEAGWDIRTVKERLADYPNDYEELTVLEDRIVVFSMDGAVSGVKLWEEFLKQVEAGTAAWVDIARFTVKGDAVIETVYYDGEVFRLCVDTSRDAFGSKDNVYYEAEYAYMQKLEKELERGSVNVQYVLTDLSEDLNTADLTGIDNPYYGIVYYIEK